MDRDRTHQGSYEVQDVQFGKVYKWRPENVVVRCERGEKARLTGSMTTCGCCGANHAAPVQKESDAWQPEDEAARPWRYAEAREEVGIPY